jgi:hypothetical protein
MLRTTIALTLTLISAATAHAQQLLDHIRLRF